MPEPRIVQNPQRAPSSLSQILPRDVPIDYFRPDYYNKTLTIREKARYADTGVAFPLEKHCSSEEDIAKWKKMSASEFMKTYGKEVLALYEIPTQEEIDQIPDSDEDEDESDNEDTEYEDEDVDEEDEVEMEVQE